MSVRRIVAVALALLLAVGAWKLWLARRSGATVPKKADTPSAAIVAQPSSSVSPVLASNSPDPTVSRLADALNAPAGSIRADLEIVSQLLEAFRTNFLASGNPVGDNAEITAALAGRNKLHVAFISPRHAAINARGELCDRWGTPFFFHQNSGTQMEIRSAGPDRKLWSDDDVVLTP